jgi:3-deoxy-D-manno-octulosonic-acid transferase
MRSAFVRLAFAAVQNDAIAQRFRAMGIPADRVHVTGTMKWDTARLSDTVEGAECLANEMGIDRSRPLIVAGSTAPGEHELLHQATPPGVQLLCAPRKPEWFDQAARALPGCVRRSNRSVPETRGLDSDGRSPDRTPQASSRFLLDTIGELRQAYALADLVVIGRSFGGLHGSDMMEPAALGKAVIVGPAVRDFQDSADALLEGDGLIQTTANDLPRVIAELLDDPQRRTQLAANARRVIVANQGATGRHAAMLRDLFSGCPPARA